MHYQLIQLPISKTFEEMDSSDRSAYRNWFLARLADRPQQLQIAVNESDKFRWWRADSSEDSLRSLAPWFDNNVSIQNQKGRIGKAVNFPPHSQIALSSRSLSLGFDVGIYIGLTLQKQFPFLEWVQVERTARDANYGHVVLTAPRFGVFNAVRIGIAFVTGLADHRHNSHRLLEIHSFWREKARSVQQDI